VGAAAGVLGKGRGWGGVGARRIDPIARRMADRALVMENKLMVGMDVAPGGIPSREGKSRGNAWHGPYCGPQEARGLARCRI